MKYNDIADVETEITNNDYVTYDVKQGKSAKKFSSRFKKIKMPKNKMDLLIIPLFALTVVSLGFLIAQITQISLLTDVSHILSAVL